MTFASFHSLRKAVLLVLAVSALTGCSQKLSKPPEHGASLIVKSDGLTDAKAPALLKEIVTRRIDRFGAQAFVESISNNELRVAVPITDPKQLAALIDLLSRRGMLEFRLVHESSERLIFEGKTNSEPAYEILIENRTMRQSTQFVSIPVLVKKTPELSGSHIQRATVHRDPISNQPTILLKFDEQGAASFAQITAGHVGRQLAIVLDRQLVSSPRITEPIRAGSASINGNFSILDALALACVLENPSPFPLTVRLEKTY